MKNNNIVKIAVLILVLLFGGVTGTNLLSDDSSSSSTEKTQETTTTESTETTETSDSSDSEYVEYHFRNERYLNQHYNKHGKEMGFESAEAYEQAASDVINNKNALHKTESEDGDGVYYLEDTNEFVILSTDGYIRTYFNPDRGMEYYEDQ